MYKFAHMSDIHLGAYREPALQELELKTFNNAMDKCIELRVDFILISGDFFHIGIPDLEIVDKAIRKMREIQKKQIPIYVIYGSHDYTPTGTSIIDILDATGILTKIVKWRMEDGKIKLDFFIDPKTGAKIVGISARKIGLESKYYELMDKESLENEEGFKIFMFHSGLNEFKPTWLSNMESVPVSYFPRGFNYYAGGHMHERGEYRLPSYEEVVFPGPLFTGYGKDLEISARGAKRGFYIVSFDEKVEKVEFVEITNFKGTYFEYDATGKNSIQADQDLQQRLSDLDVKDKLVVLKIRGELLGGKTSDINFTKIKAKLTDCGALFVYLNRYGLISKEYSAVRIMGEDISTIEIKLFKENAGSVKVSNELIKDEKGALVGNELLKVLRQPAKFNESKKEYLDRMNKSGIEVLKLKEMFEVDKL